MEIKKNLKRFLTLSRRHDGFTLVELIVVIAILAILAGIAVPAYSGYIKKANKAADLQLLGAVNTAFSAAMVANSVNAKDLGTAEIALSEDMKVTGIKSLAGTEVEATTTAVSVSATLAQACNNSFMMFFAGNEGTAFKVIVELQFDPATGTFTGIDGDGNSTDDEGESGSSGTTGAGTYEYNGIKITVSQDVVDLLNKSGFKTVGGEKLLNTVNLASFACTGQLTDEDSALYSAVFNSTDYLGKVATSVGMTTSELEDYIFDELDDEQRVKFMANSLILTTAQSADSLNTETLLSNIQSGKLQLDVSNTEGIEQTAAVYALYTAYAGSTGAKPSITVLNEALKNPDSDFIKYVTSNGAADLEAYQAAMGVISDATSGESAAASNKDLLNSGFEDAELQTILNSILNGTSSSTENK